MQTLGIIIADIIHILVTVVLLGITMNLLEHDFKIDREYGFTICLLLMVGHWYLFNGCVLNYIIDKPIAHVFGTTDYLADHKFSDTIIYKWFTNK